MVFDNVLGEGAHLPNVISSFVAIEADENSYTIQDGSLFYNDLEDRNMLHQYNLIADRRGNTLLLYWGADSIITFKQGCITVEDY